MAVAPEPELGTQAPWDWIAWLVELPNRMPQKKDVKKQI